MSIGPATVLAIIASVLATLLWWIAARLKVPDEETCDVKCDLIFGNDNIDYLIDWINNINNNNKLMKLFVQKERVKSPTERFTDAVRAIEITKNL